MRKTFDFLDFLQVLRRIVLTTEETVYRRFLIGKRYAETHPDDPRNHVRFDGKVRFLIDIWRFFKMISPTPSNVSSKSKSGRDSRLDAKRLAEAKNRKTNLKTTSQTLPVRRRTRRETKRVEIEKILFLNRFLFSLFKGQTKSSRIGYLSIERSIRGVFLFDFDSI